MEIDFTKTTSFKNSEDLMIGNIIQYKKGHLAKVEELNDVGLVSVKGIESDYITGRYNIDNWYGIPLSTKVLKLLGFKCPKNSFIFTYENNTYDSYITICVGYNKDAETWFLNNFGKIEYLHELQNYVRIRFKKNLNFNINEKDLKFINND